MVLRDSLVRHPEIFFGVGEVAGKYETPELDDE
jgi:hypothetical protein